MKFLPTCFAAVLLALNNNSNTVDAANNNNNNNSRKLLDPTDPAAVIADKYIVVFDGAVVRNVAKKAAQLFTKDQIKFKYDGSRFGGVVGGAAFKGVSVSTVMSPQLLQQLQDDPQVLYIEQNVAFGFDARLGDSSKTQNQTQIQSQTDAPAHLDRLDQDALPLDGIYKYKETGKGVTVFILDTGMRLTHEQFEGRAVCGFDAVLGVESAIPCEDKHGHGTHVAGLVGGKTVGVAKQVDLVAVKVGIKTVPPVDGMPPPPQVGGDALIAGIGYVQQQKEAKPDKPMIAVISISGPKNRALNEATRELINAGVIVVVSAGNGGFDSCNWSPASVAGAITVGSVLRNDTIADWSNFGSCVDIYATGEAVLSAWKKTDNQLAEAEGTSQSGPLVAGVAAMYLQTKPLLTPKQVWQAIRKDANKKVLLGALVGNNHTNSSENLFLLHTGAFTDSKNL